MKKNINDATFFELQALLGWRADSILSNAYGKQGLRLHRTPLDALDYRRKLNSWWVSCRIRLTSWHPASNKKADVIRAISTLDGIGEKSLEILGRNFVVDVEDFCQVHEDCLANQDLAFACASKSR